MELEDWLNNELQTLNKFELMALILDFAEKCSSIEELANFIDNWSKHY